MFVTETSQSWRASTQSSREDNSYPLDYVAVSENKRIYSVLHKRNNTIHEASKQNDLFPCSKCGKLYKWRTNLLRHKRLECGKEPQFQCPYCPKKSNRNDTLWSHIKIVHRISVPGRSSDLNFIYNKNCFKK